MVKKLLCSIIILAVAGFAHAEIPPLDNPGFEDGMSGWGTWGSGSGSGPSGYKWTQHWAYIDTTGNGAGGSNNFMNMTTTSQIGYSEYWGWGNNIAWRSSSDDIVPAPRGDWFKMGVWAKDIGGYGGRVQLEFSWSDEGGYHNSDIFLFDVTAEWLYYEAWAQTPEYGKIVPVTLRPFWGAADPGTEIGIDDLSFVPEPMSIALLGLGALGLRRRK